jgi:tRNA-specific adenosine deaminase 1
MLGGDASIIPKVEKRKIQDDDQNDPKRSKLEEVENASGKNELDKDDFQDIHRTGAKCVPTSDLTDSREKGVAYHVTGVVRTKPGRGDPTTSMSCSDKIAKWLVLGIQGSLLSVLLDKPIYLKAIVLGK